MASRGMSRGDLLLLALVLAIGGIADAAYLTWQWYAEAGASFCDVNAYFSCSEVRRSIFSSVAGVPTAVIGLAGFVILAALAGLAFSGRARVGSWRIEPIFLGFAVLGALVGAGLFLIEIFIIHAICLLCVIGFALDLGITGLAAVLLKRGSGQG